MIPENSGTRACCSKSVAAKAALRDPAYSDSSPLRRSVLGSPITLAQLIVLLPMSLESHRVGTMSTSFPKYPQVSHST